MVQVHIFYGSGSGLNKVFDYTLLLALVSSVVQVLALVYV